MNNPRWPIAIVTTLSLLFCASLALADCQTYVNQSEMDFTHNAKNNPLNINNDITTCVQNNYCATAQNPATCVVTLTYYASIADFYAQKATQSDLNPVPPSLGSGLGAKPPATPPNYYIRAGGAPAPVTNTINPTATPNSSNNNFYSNIKF